MRRAVTATVTAVAAETRTVLVMACVTIAALILAVWSFTE